MRAMKLLSLILLLASFQAFAGHDWQLSIKHPDGRVETKNYNDSDGFFFEVGDHICSVSEPEDFDFGQEYFDVNCSRKGSGFGSMVNRPTRTQEFTRWGSSNVEDLKGKKYQFEILEFNDISKRNRKPFSDKLPFKDIQ